MKNEESQNIISPISFDYDLIGNNFIYFTVPGEPFAKQRPRATKKGRFITVYTPRETKLYESKVRTAYHDIYSSETEKLNGPITAKIEAIFEPPKSISNKKRQLLESGEPHLKKPDCDNIGKVCLDALNGIVYEDDSIIDKLLITKRYGKKEGVKITIIERSNKEINKNDTYERSR